MPEMDLRQATVHSKPVFIYIISGPFANLKKQNIKDTFIKTN